MILYESGGCHHLSKIFQLHGSVFPHAFFVAFPAALVSACIRHLVNTGYLAEIGSIGLMHDAAPWSGFSFFVGFLIVFRTSEAYSRFWEGCSLVYKMRAEWFDACSALVAFCKYSKESPDTVFAFQGRLIRLFSMLHASALAAIEDSPSNDMDQVTAYTYELIDAEGVDEDSLRTLLDSEHKVELIFQWIQQLVVESIHTGVLSIPPPILSRAFDELANGMVNFHEAVKITAVPFPFPYAQTCDCLLVIHWLVAPYVVAQWVTEPQYAVVFTFLQVFTLWSLNFIAVEVENPFGLDANDLDFREMQLEINRSLLLLLRPGTLKTPVLTDNALDLRNAEMDNLSEGAARVSRKSFKTVWASIQASISIRENASERRRSERRPSVMSARPSLMSVQSDNVAPEVVPMARKQLKKSLSMPTSFGDTPPTSERSAAEKQPTSPSERPSPTARASVYGTSGTTSTRPGQHHKVRATPWANCVFAASLQPRPSANEPQFASEREPSTEHAVVYEVGREAAAANISESLVRSGGTPTVVEETTAAIAPADVEAAVVDARLPREQTPIVEPTRPPQMLAGRPTDDERLNHMLAV